MGLKDSVADGLRRFADALGKPSFAGTPFPEGTVAQPQQLTEELGGTGTFLFGGFLRGEDPLAAMDGLTAIRNLDEMRRSDAQVHASLEVVKQPIRTASYEVDPADPEDPRAVAIAEFVRWNLFTRMGTTWDDLIRQSLLMLDFGVMLFEKVWAVEEDGQYAGKVVIHRLAPRPPKTLWQWFTDEDGRLISIKQLAVKAGTYQFLDIPASKLVRFTFQQEGDNFMGISMLRSAYPHYAIKRQLYNIDAIRATRFGVGIPRAKFTQGFHPTKEDRDAMATMLQGLSSHPHAYLMEPPQFTVDILMPTGGSQQTEVLPSIEHHNQQITRNILAQFLDMGGRASGGSNALGSSAMDFFLNAIESIAGQICDALNKQLVKDLVDMNFDDVHEYPTIRAIGIHETDLASLTGAAAQLAGAGLLTPDADTEGTFRELMNLPQVKAPAGQPAAPPPATGGGQAADAERQPVQPASVPGKGEAPSAQRTPATTAPPAGAAVSMARAGMAVSAKPAGTAVSAAPAGMAALAPSAATEASDTADPRAVHEPGNTDAVSVGRPVNDFAPTIVTPVTSHDPRDGTVARSTYGGGAADAVTRAEFGAQHLNVAPSPTPMTRADATGTLPGTAVPGSADSVAVPAQRAPGYATSTETRTLPVRTDLVPSLPERPQMARSTVPSSGDADEEGHTSSAAGSLTAFQPYAAASQNPADPERSLTARQPRQDALSMKDSPWTDGQLTFWRQPTPLEMRCLDLREMPNKLHTARTGLHATLQAVRREQISRIASAVAHAGPDAADVKPPLVGKMASDIVKAMRPVYEYGQNAVRAELQRQRHAAFRFAEGDIAFGGPGSGWHAEQGHVPGSQGGRAAQHHIADDTWYHGSVTSDISEFSADKLKGSDPDAPYTGIWLSTSPRTSPAFRNPTTLYQVVPEVQNPITRPEATRLARQWLNEPDVNERIAESGAKGPADYVRMRLLKSGYDSILHADRPSIDTEELERTGQTTFIDGSTWRPVTLKKDDGYGGYDLYDRHGQHITGYDSPEELTKQSERVLVVLNPPKARITKRSVSPWVQSAPLSEVRFADVPTTPAKAVPHLVASAKLTAQGLTNKLLALAQQEALRLQRSGWDEDEIEDALEIHLGDLSDADLKMAAAQEVNEAFALGRATAAQEIHQRTSAANAPRDEQDGPEAGGVTIGPATDAQQDAGGIAFATYSAILDDRVCEPCASNDGKEVQIGSDEYEELMPPFAGCKGRDQCRCMWIYTYKDDGDADVQGSANDEGAGDEG